MNLKKHSLDDDDDDSSDDENYKDFRSGKRIKLDSLLEDLSLNHSNKSTHPFIDNKDKDKDKDKDKPKRDYIIPKYSGGVFKKPNAPQSYSSSQLDSFINERIVDHFQNIITSSLKLIHWYNYKFLIVFRLQKWFVKLFNRFVRKYNQKNNLSIRPFKTYDQIIALIHDKFITWNDLGNIIDEENKLEMKRLAQKEKNRKSEKDQEDLKKESETFKDLGYDYWDNLKFDKDLDMLDADDDDLSKDEPKVVELGAISDDDDNDNDIQMSDETPTSFGTDANYGSYYHRD
ncbi:uncharacterized protein KGF55_000143 [Candida pseudojiufengensis]|uniref:uncharacterized protein n=1 Tax=Candida pseudojiufengensis TaxID=497109 RepID=UPI00222547AF|nr:uncharacterized protein KGF55_000143 [Candida pseudojiufengensis]KAI5966734.1 hypothetical protein KGF55_000143 [Candida pseudojiufengensis]